MSSPRDQPPAPPVPLHAAKDPAVLGAVFRQAGFQPGNPFLISEIPVSELRADRAERAAFVLSADTGRRLHVTIGRGLARLWERSRALVGACPAVSPTPRFLVSQDGWDYLGIDQVAGSGLETLVASGRLDAAGAVRHAEQLLSRLRTTTQASTSAALNEELSQILAAVLALPVWGMVDRTFFRDVVFPFVREGLPAGRITKRWTNGDFTARNVLIDETGGPQLIDHEFAVLTHFAAEDLWRWKQFSQLPSAAKALSEEPGAMRGPWFETVCILRQMVLSHDTNGADLALPYFFEGLGRIGVLVSASPAFAGKFSASILPAMARGGTAGGP